MIKSVLVMLIACLVTGHQQTCWGALTIGFSDTGGSSTFTVNVGDTFNLPVYLLQSAPDVILTTEGLIGMGTRAVFDATLIEIDSITINPAFEFQPSSSINNTLGTLEFTGSTFTPVIGSEILLGTVTITAVAPGTSNLNFGDLSPNLADFGTALGTNLDPQIFGPALDGTYAATVTAVSEPSSYTLVGIAMAVGLVRRRRRR